MAPIITLTTIPSRLSYDGGNVGLEDTITSLLAQTHSDIEVWLNVPWVMKRDNVEYTIPEWATNLLESDSRFKINRCDDQGSATKLLPTLDLIEDKDQIIIVVDDDHTYHEDMVKEHLKHRLNWPEFAIGYDGQRARDQRTTARAVIFDDPRDHWVGAHGLSIYVDILQHYKSVSYTRGMFKEDFNDFWTEYKHWCDDTCIAAYMSKHRTPRVVAGVESERHHKDLTHEGWQEACCHKTFPITGNTTHERQEGCNIPRDLNEKDDLKTFLYVEYIDKGYDNAELIIIDDAY